MLCSLSCTVMKMESEKGNKTVDVITAEDVCSSHALIFCGDGFVLYAEMYKIHIYLVCQYIIDIVIWSPI